MDGSIWLKNRFPNDLVKGNHNKPRGRQMSAVVACIENKDLDLTKTEKYAAILGESPSKGAKSPALWNAAFAKLGLSGLMHPMDVLPENLSSVVDCLRDDECFIGGAVTMPYKIAIMPYLDDLESEAETIGAVNCIYRDGKRLVGTNTDGAGALWSLQEEFGSLEGKTVLLLGTGGAGFAVAAYVASALGTSGTLLLANRSAQPLQSIAGKLQELCKIESLPDWPVTIPATTDIDIVINCSSIGFETLKADVNGVYSLKYYTPLGKIDDSIRVPDKDAAEREYIRNASGAIADNIIQSLKFLAAVEAPLVFDIIYQPFETLFLSLAKLTGCNTLNGLPMNLEQAVIAFDKATVASGMRSTNAEEVRMIMGQIS